MFSGAKYKKTLVCAVDPPLSLHVRPCRCLNPCKYDVHVTDYRYGTQSMRLCIYMSLLFCTVASKQDRLRHIVAKNPVPPRDGVFTRLMLWDDEKCKELMGSSFDKIKSHNKKIIGAYRADLCRLYVLYKYGGTYTDDDIWLLREPPVSNTLITVVKESPVFKKKSRPFYFNAFISVPRKRHPGILRAIRLSLKTITHIPKKFSDGPDLWGPWVLYTALRNYTTLEFEETCTVHPCDCHVKNLLWSHRPCAY